MRFRKFVFIFLVLIMMITTYSAQNTEMNEKNFSQEIGNLDNSIKRLNSDIVESKKLYRSTVPFRFQERNRISDKIVQKAKERKTKMLKIAEKSPQKFLSRALSDREKKQIPLDAKEHIEKGVSVRGKVRTSIADDFSDPTEPKVNYEQHIRKNGKVLEIESTNPKELIVRNEISLEGYKLNGTLVTSGLYNKETGTSSSGDSESFMSGLMTGEQTINLSNLKDIPIVEIGDRVYKNNRNRKQFNYREDICRDNDGDGYYNQTEKCRLPIDVERTKPDCDDSDPEIGGSENCEKDSGSNQENLGPKYTDRDLEIGDSKDFPEPKARYCPRENRTMINGTCSLEYEMAVILADYGVSKKPFTRKEAHDRIFNGNFQKFYKQQSYNNIHFKGETFGWFDINTKPLGCDNSTHEQYDRVFPHINRTVKRKGVNLSKYDKVLIISNERMGCPTGMAVNNIAYNRMGGSDWNREPYSQPYFANNGFRWHGLEHITVHEIGHTLGLGHSGSWDCGNVPLPSKLDQEQFCSYNSYGNKFSNMGYDQFSLHFPAYKKKFLGWLNKFEGDYYVKKPRKKQSNFNLNNNYHEETLTLKPISEEDGKRAAFILNPQTLGTEKGFSIEYRSGEGYNSGINSNKSIEGGLLISKYANQNNRDFTLYSGGELINTDPSTKMDGWKSTAKAPLSDKKEAVKIRDWLKIGPIINKSKDEIKFNISYGPYKFSQGSCKEDIEIQVDDIYGVNDSVNFDNRFHIFDNRPLNCPGKEYNVSVSGIRTINSPNSLSSKESLSLDLRVPYSHWLGRIFKYTDNLCNGRQNATLEIRGPGNKKVKTRDILINVSNRTDCSGVSYPDKRINQL